MGNMNKGKIKLLFFGITHDIAQQKEREFELNGISSAGELREALEREYPKLKDLRSFAIAVNEEYATSSTSVSEYDEVALIPPVSGG